MGEYKLPSEATYFQPVHVWQDVGPRFFIGSFIFNDWHTDT